MNTEEKRRAAQREYYRQYRAKNKERIKANNQRYWDRKAARMEKEQEEGKRNV